MSHKPFPRQQESIDKMYKFVGSKTSKKGLFVYPVAYGKSIVIAHVAALFPEKYFINICPNKELTEQNYKTFCSYGYKASVCSASLGKNEISQITFATIGTIKKHIEFYKDKEVVLLNDEAQNSALKGSQLDVFIKSIKNCKVIGTTGTPVRLDSGMMGTELKMMNRMRKCFYSSIEDVVQISEVISNKRWSKLIYEVENIDESYLQLNTTGTEYTLSSLKAFSDANDLIDKAKVATERLLSEGRKSVLIYMPFIEDAEKLTIKIPGAEVLHSKISKKKRKQVVDDFKSGKVKVLVNCLILVEGFNYPELSAIIQCRPTNSINQWYQSLGRGTRVHPDKKDCKIIDLSGNFNKFGKIEELVFEEIPYFGWAMLNGKGEILTGYPLTSKYKPTRESVIENGKRKEKQELEKVKQEKVDENPVITFGMWKNRKVWDIARNEKDARRFRSWCDWFIKEQEKPSLYPKNFVLINAINKYLKKDAEQFNTSNLFK